MSSGPGRASRRSWRGTLKENDLRGDLVFIDRARSVLALLDLIREEQGGAPFSQRQAVAALRDLGYVVPLTELKANPGRVVKYTADAHRPGLLTSRGRGVAVLQSIADYEQAEEERAFMRAVAAGLANLEAGREVSPIVAKARLALEGLPGDGD